MTFMESVRTCLKENYCNFEGRAPRSEYWWFTLFGVLLGIVTSVLDGFLGTYTVTSSGETIGFINLIFLLAMLLPSIAVAVRRLHDTDRSGWFYLLNLIPLIGSIILIVFFVQQGTNGRNRFGDDPL
ncbi:DUF805 domain-containing protein [uncultured Campylobacter sp.]|jgi:inner membrane protein yhaI|uniref:DUF805 domain-containing protein n=1 Tax=uncultured Campylobacter sp. TaxID=218934 RepID=UPI001CAB9F70|nr:DUF805 domain-containing protein [uncultured Campylobacter sp.]MBF0985155.1 DUF805 domain-containing protein [Campylobacter sp.]